eukprot:scaffold76160_cov30-Tisochrysis_lutea.AAC.3
MPKDFLLPVPPRHAFNDSYYWIWEPEPPSLELGAVPGMCGAATDMFLTSDIRRQQKSLARNLANSRVVGPQQSSAKDDFGESGPAVESSPPGTGSSTRTRPRTAPLAYRRARRSESHGNPHHLPLGNSPFGQPQSDDPARLCLKRIVGFTGETAGIVIWLPQPELIAYAACSTIIVQRHLLGHTAPICALASASSAAGTLLASAQEGPLALVRLWDVTSGQAVAKVNSSLARPALPSVSYGDTLAMLHYHASNMRSIALSASGHRLATVGKDVRGRQEVAVWDTSRVWDASRRWDPMREASRDDKEGLPVVDLLDCKASAATCTAAK